MKFLVSARLDIEASIPEGEELFAHSRVAKGILLHQVLHVHDRGGAWTALSAAFLVEAEDEDHVELFLEGIEDVFDWEVRTVRALGHLSDVPSDADVFEAFAAEEEEAIIEEEDEEDDEDEDEEDDEDEEEADDE